MQVKEEKVEMIVSDSDDLAQKGIFSDNQGSDDNDDDLDEGITVKSLNDVKWTPVLEVKLEDYRETFLCTWYENLHQTLAYHSKPLQKQIPRYLNIP